jgi:hypothetical protein
MIVRGLAKMFGREFYFRKGATKVVDKKSDAVAYVSEYLVSKTGAKRYQATVFYGKQTKPVANYTYVSEERRNKAVAEYFEGRQKSMAFKVEQRTKRTSWVPDYKVGELLRTSWGYDQTNVEYFEVVQVKGKYVWLREIAQKRSATGHDCGQTVPLPGQYLKPRFEGDKQGETIRRLAQQSGVRICDVRSASRCTPKMVAGVPVYSPVYWSSYH